MSKIAIIGAGIIGRLIALNLCNFGHKISIFDRNSTDGKESSSYKAAGMLAPFSELDVSERMITELGLESFEIWPKIIAQFEKEVFFQRNGSLIIAHHNNKEEIERFIKNITTKFASIPYKLIKDNELFELENDIDKRFFKAIYIETEGQIDARQILLELYQALLSKNIEMNFGQEITNISPYEVNKQKFDLVIDTRGQKANLKNLRPVKGEIIEVKTKMVSLSRPVRLLHPRYPLYIVPKPNNHFLIGATSIESDDESPMKVRSALELLSAAFAVNSGFAEAEIIGLHVGFRPVFPDHLPKIIFQNGLIRVNGLYRHGFLISPKLAELVVNFINNHTIPNQYSNIFYEEKNYEFVY